MNAWEGLSQFFGRIRPQIFLSLLILGLVAYVSIMENLNEVAVGCIAGIIALSKDVLNQGDD
jgi:hypothetical protein|tara:strand:- start:318 stop:503 length:186 start_codon:yes stop_codon:yes gene_type:complete